MVQSIDRNLVQWEDHILDLSPVENYGGLWFKREDKFAPLGYGGINGSKLRVCIWLISEAYKQGAKGIVHGAVTGSPQHPMVACIGSHFGLPVVDCIGTKKPKEHDTLEAAAWMGASFRSFNPGYAATLNSKAAQLSKNELGGYFHLETNITLDDQINPAERIEAFHRVGSEQVKNIPDQVETMIIPAGSCNSVTGIMYGITRFRPKNLKKIVLMGIGSYGSSDPAYIQRRLNLIGSVTGEKMDNLFRYSWNKAQPMTPYEVIHYNVNDGCGACEKCRGGYCEYNDLMPYDFQEGFGEKIEFHPRYESKTFHYMKDHLPEFRQYLNDRTLYWIVGSKPDAAVMVPKLRARFGDLKV
jgi:hypothetical protein